MVDEKKDVKAKGSNKTLIILIVAFLVIVGIIVLIAVINSNGIGYAINIPSPTPNCHNVQVPYDDVETYTDSEPYTDNVCTNINLVYRLDQGTCVQMSSGFLGLNPSPSTYDCTITNLDSQPGDFSVNIGFYVNGQKLEKISPVITIYPQQTYTFKHSEMAKEDSCYCREAQIPTKQECHDVTKYHDVQRQRTVTKYRTEQQCN